MVDAKRTDWIQTYTGKQFFPLDPKLNDIDIRDIAHSLSLQCRYNGHSRRFYSVAQHSTIMATNFGSTPESKLVLLLHDASEAYLSDIPSPIKHLPEFEFYRHAEARLQELIYRRFLGVAPVDDSWVKPIDKEMIFHEASSPDVMHPVHPDWQMPPHSLEKMKVRLMAPLEAESVFLDVFEFLMAKIGGQNNG